MKSVTKYQVSEAEICAAFRAAGIGEVTAIQELSDGWYNSVYSVTAENGKRYVIKIAPADCVKVLTHERNMMEAEVGFYRLIHQKTTIKTPQIIYSDHTKTVLPTPYFIMDFLSGTRLDKARLTRAERERATEQWAWVFSELHRLKGEGYGYTQTGLRENWKDALTGMTQFLIDDAAAFGKNCRTGKRLLSYIEKYSDCLQDVPCSLTNFDLHPMNIFCNKTANGTVELCILDLERGFWGDPIGDFVSVEFFRPFRKKKILAPYNRFAEAKIGTGREEEIRYYLLCAYLAAVMYTERFSRFQGVGKYLHPVYLAGTVAGKFLSLQAFSALKRLGKV